MKKSFHIVGMGRVGRTFAALLARSGAWQPVAAVSRKGAAVWADCQSAVIVPDVRSLPPADVVLVCTPDNVLEETAATLAGLEWLGRETVVVHFSGAKTIGVLDAVVKCGATVGSLHPVFAFADVEKSVRSLRGSLCALEARDERAMAVLRDLADTVGLRAFVLPSEHKAHYHAALSAASNFSVVLAAFAQNLLEPVGLPESLARGLVAGLMGQSVENLSGLTPADALTGPVVRGDDSTVAAHLAAMNDKERVFYSVLANAALDLAGPRLNEGELSKLRALLESK